MTPHGTDPHDPVDPDNGVLAEGPGLATTGIDILGAGTAHVSIVLPQNEDDELDDDDVVEGDVEVLGELLAEADHLDAAPEDHVYAEPFEAVTAEVVVEDYVEDAHFADDPDLVQPDPVEPYVVETSHDEVAHEETDVARAIDEAPEPATGPVASVAIHEPAPVRDDAPWIPSFRSAHRDPSAHRDAQPPVVPDPKPQPEPELAVEPAREPDAVPETSLSEPEHEVAVHPEASDAVPSPVSAAAPPASVAAVTSRSGVERTTTDPTVLVSRRIGEMSNVSERETADLLTPDRLLDHKQVTRPEPEGGWNHFLFSITGGLINLGDNKRARARKALDRKISAQLPGGARFVAVVSRKGGVGKTTVTALLGMALADARDDRVIAVDANPDRGTLAERITRQSGKTVRDLVREREHLRGYNDVSMIVARDETRLDVLASDTDPRVHEALSDVEYRTVAEVAAHYYSIVLTDTGTGIVHSVMGATLDVADQLVIVAGLSIDEAKLASETLTWLEMNGHEEQVRNAIVVLNMSSPGAPLVRQDQVEAHFRTRVRDVVRVPYDPAIATGGAIMFRELKPETRLAARTLAAKVVEGLRSLTAAA